ncbi:MAG: peptidylprolyl isomerase [Prevotella sp.]
MKSRIVLAALLFANVAAYGQNDPTIMTINGEPVTRSEFEYSYNKNNSETVVDKKSVSEYVDLFVNYKLKVLAAKEAGIDTTKAFRTEYATYRDLQVRPTFVNGEIMEHEAWKVYRETQQRVDSTGGMVKPAHILVMVRQQAAKEALDKAKVRIDSIYTALKQGADFAQLAEKCSDDQGSARRGGELSWISRGQTLQEFEDKAYSLKVGELSEPFQTAAGYHIILLKDKGMFFPYDSVRTDVRRFVEQRGVRERIITEHIDSIAKAAQPQLTAAQVIEQRTAELEAKDSDLRNLLKEYHDGLLLYEISNQTVWDKAAKDKDGLAAFFKKNKKRYRWDAPRFKGIAYHVKEQADVEAVKKAVEKLPFDQWAEKLRTTFNDSIRRIQVVKGIFKQGDNALVDRDVFKKDTTVAAVSEYPIDAIYGKVLKAPKSYEDVREQVVADYQEKLEKDWVNALRRKYTFEVDESVLATVNNHE